MGYDHIRALLQDRKVVVKDGGFGTYLFEKVRQSKELEDAKVWSGKTKMWSTRAALCNPNLAREVHLEYLEAGADVITTGAFRSNESALRREGWDVVLSRPVTKFIASIATELRSEPEAHRDFAVAGNLTGVNEVRHPDLSPGEGSYDEHFRTVGNLLDAECDLILIETMPKLKEAAIALKAAYASCANRGKESIPIWLSLELFDKAKRKDPVLLDGTTPVKQIPTSLIEHAGRLPDAVLLNCSAPEAIDSAMDDLVKALDGRAYAGAYANYLKSGTLPRGKNASGEYSDWAMKWIGRGAKIVGGCCGTTPEDIEVLRKRVDDWNSVH